MEEFRRKEQMAPVTALSWPSEALP